MITLNGHEINVTMFPDKTSQVWKLPERDVLKSKDTTRTSHVVRWKFENESEFMHLAQLKFLLDTTGIPVILYLPYLPYARQDKDVANDRTFALLPFAYLLNSLNFHYVHIDDPHSEVALSLIDSSTENYPVEEVKELCSKENIDLLCYPDKGARTKYHKLFGPFFPHIYGEKSRDQSTGFITGYELIGSPKDKNVLIVDDLCDGGATFKILAKDLLANGAKRVVLFVSHGIFSKGIDTLLESGIHKVYTWKDGKLVHVTTIGS
jgi:phosphoribosylpyrophosphate synthetase